MGKEECCFLSVISCQVFGLHSVNKSKAYRNAVCWSIPKVLESLYELIN